MVRHLVVRVRRSGPAGRVGRQPSPWHPILGDPWRGGPADDIGFTCSSRCTAIADGFIGLSGYPARPFGWDQFRTLGAGALDLCLVAEGTLDGFVDCVSGHGVWDYAGAWLVCHEAGALMVDGLGRELIIRDYTARRAPVAAATPELLDALLEARRLAVLAT